MNCTLEYVNGPIEVYDADGAFLFSGADILRTKC